jgi:DNA-directed RNA polymerase specialized sigma24 family protein
MRQQMSQIPEHAHDHRQLKRGHIEYLLALTEFLPPKDRVLAEHVLSQGNRLTTIATLYQRPPRQLQRRAATIIKRISTNMFQFVALQMNTLPAETRATAKYIVLHGLSQRQTSQTIGITIHRVRLHMNTVHATARLLAKPTRSQPEIAQPSSPLHASA